MSTQNNSDNEKWKRGVLFALIISSVFSFAIGAIGGATYETGKRTENTHDYVKDELKSNKDLIECTAVLADSTLQTSKCLRLAGDFAQNQSTLIGLIEQKLDVTDAEIDRVLHKDAGP